MDRYTYDKVLEACALLPDLSIIPGGDMTEIGERVCEGFGGFEFIWDDQLVMFYPGWSSS